MIRDAGALADGGCRDRLRAADVVINEINRGELEILLPRYQSDHARFMRYIPKKISCR